MDAPSTGLANPLDDPFSDDNEDFNQPSDLESASDDDEEDDGELEADTFINAVEREDDGYMSSSSDSSASSSSSTSSLASKSKIQSSKKSRASKPAWFDPDDALVQVSLSTDKRLRKLRRGEEEDIVGGKDLESRLRTQSVSLLLGVPVSDVDS